MSAILFDVGLFTQWINAPAEDRQDLADFYSTRFRPEFRPAFDAWLATDPQGNVDAPISPFVMAEYEISSLVESDALEEEAAQTFEQGQVANEQADAYIPTAVLLASVLFFAGIASGFDWMPVQIGVIVVGAVLLAWGLYSLVTYPIL